MKEGWKEVTIADVCNKVYSGGTPKSTQQEYYDHGDIPWLNTKEIAFNRIHKTENYITTEGFNNSSAKWVPENSVIVAMYGATAGRSAITKIPLTTNQACCNLIINDKIADYNFVYHYIYSKYTELASLANGGAQQNLNAKQVKEFPISLPPLPIQHKIASILSAIDDKIELNQRMNENLEAQAQALFKSWFVDFEPWGGVMPEDWEVGKLSDTSIKITDGVHNTVKDSPNSEYFLLSCKNIIGGKLKIGVNERTIDEETFKKLRKRTQLEKGDILLSSVGTVGELLLLQSEPNNIEFQRSVAIIKPNPEVVSPEFLFCSLCASKDKIKQSAHGAVQQCIFLKDINDFAQLIPSFEAVKEFTQTVEPLYTKVYSNERESSRLAALRDTLLPRLMSGELDVENINI